MMKWLDIFFHFSFFSWRAANFSLIFERFFLSFEVLKIAETGLKPYVTEQDPDWTEIQRLKKFLKM